MKQLITHKELIDYCTYNQFTGKFLRNANNKTRIGYYDKSLKQRVLCINGKKYRETKIAVFYVTGQWPVGRVKTTSSRRFYNTKFRDLVYALPKEEYLYEVKVQDKYFELAKSQRMQFCFGNGVAQEENNSRQESLTFSKKPTYFQRFLRMFPRL